MLKRFWPILMLTTLPYTASAAALTFNTEDWFPYNYDVGGKVVGTSTEILEKVASASGINYQIVLGPWNRSYNTALNQPGNCVYSTTITEERKPLFRWIQPLESVKWVVYKLKGSPLTASSLEDLKGKIIGGYVGDAVANYMKSQGFKVDEAPGDMANPKNCRLVVLMPGPRPTYPVFSCLRMQGLRLSMLSTSGRMYWALPVTKGQMMPSLLNYKRRLMV